MSWKVRGQRSEPGRGDQSTSFNDWACPLASAVPGTCVETCARHYDRGPSALKGGSC